MMAEQMTKPSMDDLPRCSSTFPPAAKTWEGGGGEGDRVLGSIYFSFRNKHSFPNKRTQHCWPTTPNIVGCYMLRPFAHPVECCCAKFEIGQTFRYVQTDATTPSSGKYLDANFQTDLQTTDKRIRSLS